VLILLFFVLFCGFSFPHETWLFVKRVLGRLMPALARDGDDTPHP
jgi:hypothetical protein